MSTRASAARYARALLDVAIKESSTDQADRELTAFADLLQQHPELQRALIHPSVHAAAKKAVVQQLLDRLQPSSPAGKLLLMLADRDRLTLVPDARRDLPRASARAPAHRPRRGDDGGAAGGGAYDAAARPPCRRDRPDA